MLQALIERLLNLAGWDRCSICRTYTSDWRGYFEDVSLCASCYDTLTEANKLMEDEL